MNQGYEDKSPLRQTKEEKSITYSKDSIIETNPEKNLSSKDKEINTSSNANNIISTESKPENISDNSDPSNKKAKTKRHRRVENEKKGRGRPKKEFLEEEYMNQTRKEYNNFLEEKKKKNDEKINFGFIKGVFDDLFNRYKNELFGSIESIEKNTFFILFKENWEKDNNSTNLDRESYSSMINCSPAVAIVNKPPIDCIFFQYIKFISNIIEKDYVVFILKFIIIFRQYINIEKKSSINSEYITKKKTEYTQIYDSSVIPDFFNDFLVDFMENRNYFFLDKDELVKIIEYFCFWLFLEGYTDSHIAKVD